MSEQTGHEPKPDAGIAQPRRIQRLLYNRASDTLVLVVRKKLDTGLQLDRLYLRAVMDASYHPVPIQDSLETHQEPVCAESAPFLIYNAIRFGATQGSPSVFPGNWVGVRRLNLITGHNEVVLSSENLQPPPGYASGWVSGVISAWADGNGAVCTVGLKRPNGERVSYSVYDVSFEHGLQRQLAALPLVFL